MGLAGAQRFEGQMRDLGLERLDLGGAFLTSLHSLEWHQSWAERVPGKFQSRCCE